MGPQSNDIIDEGNNGDVDNKGPWLSGKKRPNRGSSRSHGRTIHPNERTGIRKQVIPANQLINPLWDRDLSQWIEGKDLPVYEKESRRPFRATSQIRGRAGDNFLVSRMVSPSKITLWRKYTIGRGVHSRQHSRQPSRLSLGSGKGGRRRTHKRKNKHTRRRRVQRRRA
jgi:hypothetical protein